VPVQRHPILELSDFSAPCTQCTQRA
jgi:hypothetical protein